MSLGEWGTKTEAYRAVFEVSQVNVAVYLGKASGGLCAIDFDADEDLAAFLAVNPNLNGTLRSRASSLLQISLVMVRFRTDVAVTL